MSGIMVMIMMMWMEITVVCIRKETMRSEKKGWKKYEKEKSGWREFFKINNHHNHLRDDESVKTIYFWSRKRDNHHIIITANTTTRNLTINLTAKSDVRLCLDILVITITSLDNSVEPHAVSQVMRDPKMMITPKNHIHFIILIIMTIKLWVAFVDFTDSNLFFTYLKRDSWLEMMSFPIRFSYIFMRRHHKGCWNKSYFSIPCRQSKTY